MKNIDLREYKGVLRQEAKAYRRSLSAEVKEKKDSAILRRLLSLRQYQQASLVLTYVSTPIEVDTHQLIRQAFADGKRVGVPRCIDGTRLMEFYEIGSMEDLEKRTFGVLEPIPERCQLLTDFSKSICVVPALLYDLSGYRIGYGGGYYDRFLAQYPGYKVGITYVKCIRRKVLHGRYDVPVSALVTERYVNFLKSPPERKPFLKG